MTPTFQGEIQFRRYSDTSTQGQQIVFSVPDREALQPFIGKEGRRFMAVLVEIGDDEQPVNDGAQVMAGTSAAGNPVATPAAPSPEPAKRTVGPICYWLVQRGKEKEFQQWLKVPDEQSAAERVRLICGVASRADIDGCEHAELGFNQRIRQPYSLFLSKKGGK